MNAKIDMTSPEFADAISRGVSQIQQFIAQKKPQPKAKPMWNRPPENVPHSKAPAERARLSKVKKEIVEEEPPEIRLADREADKAKPTKVCVDKQEMNDRLRDNLGRRKELFREGRQSGSDAAAWRERITRGDAYAMHDPICATAASSRDPMQGPRPPSGPPPKAG